MLKMIFIFKSALAAAPETDVAEVEEIVVTGTRSERARGASPVATKVLTAEDLRASGAEDVADALEQVPGVDVQRGFLGAVVRLQGLDPEHVLVMVDGQRLAGRAGGGIDLSRIPLDRVERIEIVEGAASALYGSDAMGGVIHIVTRDPEPAVRADLKARAGTVGTSDLSAGVEGGGDEVQLRLDAGLHGASPSDRDPADLATTTSGVRQGQVEARLDADPSADLTVATTVAWSRLDVTGVDLSDGGAVFDRRNLQEELRWTASPRWVPDASTVVTVHAGLSAFRDQYLSDQQGADALDSYADTRDRLAQLSGQWSRQAGAHHWQVGAEGLAEWMASERLVGGRGERQRAGVYVQDGWQPAPRVELLPSARLDGDTQFGAVPTVRLAGRLDVASGLVARLAVGTGYRAPSFREQFLDFANPGAGYRIDGDPDLRPERSRQLTGSLSARWGRLSADGSGFLHDVDDLITVVTVAEAAGTTRFGYANVARARSAGGEASVSLSPVEPLTLGASYTFTDARDLTLDRPLEGRARHRGTADARLSLGGTLLSSRAAFVGSRSYYPDLEGADVRPGYVLLDARLEQRVGATWSAFAGVDNALDAGDADLTPLMPRVVYGGLTASLAPRRRTEPNPRGVP